MKKTLLMLVLGMLVATMGFAQEQEVTVVEEKIQETAGGTEEVFNIYTEKWAGDNHYAPSGWMGDFGDIKIEDNSRVDPHSGNTCIEISYTAKGSHGAGWMGIYWQNPPNNWGDQMGGYDLTGYKKLVFWAKGEKGREVISEIKIGGISGEFFDSDSASIGPIKLTKEWQQFEIDLEDLDLAYISGGFCLSARASENPEGFTVYFDDIQYVK